MRQYAAAAHKAALAADQQATSLPCANPGNNLLYCFLLEVRNMRMDREDYDSSKDHFCGNIKKAMNALKEYPLRVYDEISAQDVTHIGSAMIKEDLFALYPPEPPTERELAQLQAARAQLRATEAARKKRNAATNAEPPAARLRTSYPPSNTAAPRAGLASIARATAALASAPRGPLPQQNRRRPSFSTEIPLPPGNGGSFADMGGALVDPPRRVSGNGSYQAPLFAAAAAIPAAAAAAAPKPAKAKKPYFPKIGTANWTFLICLFQAQRGPERMEFIFKQELLSRAEASGLSDKPILPNAVPRGGFTGQNSSQFYSGMSCFKTITNHGLVAEYSNPKKVKLTHEGLALAERVYRDAVERGKISPVAGLPATGPMLFQLEDRPQGAEAVAAAGQAQAAAGLAPQALPSAALRPSRRAGATAAERRAQTATAVTLPGPAYDYDDPLEVPLAERLGRGRGMAAGAPTGAGTGTTARAPAAAFRQSSNPIHTTRVDGTGTGTGTEWRGSGEAVYLDLAGSSSDDDDDEMEIREEDEGFGTAADVPRCGTDGRTDRRVSDADVAMMMEMGFSDKKARKALRRSGDLDGALDIVTVLSSEGETTDEDEDPIIRNLNLPAMPAEPNSRRTSLDTQSTAGGRGHIRGGSQQVPRPRLEPASQSHSQQMQQYRDQSQNPALFAQSNLRVGGGGTAAPEYPPAARALPALPGTNGATGTLGGPSTMVIHGSQVPRSASNPSTSQSQQPWWVDHSTTRVPPLPPGRRFSDEYEVVLLVDGREQYSRTTANGTANRNDALQTHLARMQGAGLVVEHRTLPIGDALWIARSRRDPNTEYVLDYILERKSLTDLLASIKDSNRYTSQKYFLRRCGLKHLYYLIEGDAEALPTPRDAKTVKSAAASTEVCDGFRVLRTKGVQETFRLYQSLTESVIDLYSPLQASAGHPNRPSPAPLPSFTAFKQHMRDVNQGTTTLHDIWGRMLCEVPGLGPDAIAAILDAFPVPKALFTAYRAALIEGIRNGRGGQVMAESVLVGVQAEGGRAIGPDKAKKVFQHLFMNHWNLQGRV